MPILLTLLDGVRWDGTTVAGDRPQALLAALAAAGRTVGTERLVGLVWGEDVPANPGKALQVLVSRVRGVVGATRLVTDGDGYRLALASDQVDALLLRSRARAAAGTLGADPVAALDLAASALALAPAGVPDPASGPLADLRHAAEQDLRLATVVRARALARCGRAAEALPGLEDAARERPDDEPLLADLLRAEAAVRGPAAALERFSTYQDGVRDRLGSDPGADLQRVHREPAGDGQPGPRGRAVRRLSAPGPRRRPAHGRGPARLGTRRLDRRARRARQDHARARGRPRVHPAGGALRGAWSASRRRRTWSARSARRWACATRSPGVVP
ncbi:bacterial transcriptional activator domain-containing protein [Nocardioides convexus]|uniref:AfsR/SARP family transcriptional regulator n=1 Tax=Nocardioides convexus TaxID=2712224 RepID=UPI0024184D89|nr:bacterial transcriptional activator domain-containing protein [Nocardioides convexus]